MGRLVAAAVVAITVCAPAAIGAQTAARFGLGVSGTFPTGDFHADPSGDGFNIGWQGMIFFDVRQVGRPIALRLDGVYGENSANGQFKSDLAALIGPGVDAKIRMTGADADLVLNARPTGKRRALGYILGGIGARRVSLIASQGNVSTDTTNTKFSWNVGGGVNFPGGRSNFFLEARYVHVDAFEGAGTSTNYFPITAGIRF
jgi:hypothetical protein